jgi:hypothetical protein
MNVVNYNDWTCTDEDSAQYCMQINYTTFSFKTGLEGEVHVINLSDYDDLNIEEYVQGYYNSMDELYEECGANSLQIIAECIYETDFEGIRSV